MYWSVFQNVPIVLEMSLSSPWMSIKCPGQTISKNMMLCPLLAWIWHCIVYSDLLTGGQHRPGAESAICFLLGVDRSKLHMAFSAQVIRVTRRQMRRRHPTPQTSSSNVSNRLFRVSAISPQNSSADVIGFLLDWFFCYATAFFLDRCYVTESPKNGKLSVGSASSTVMILGKPEIWVKWEKTIVVFKQTQWRFSVSFIIISFSF